MLPLTERTKIEIVLDMPVRLIAANRRVHSDAGRVAVVRGPVVYCAEGADNGADLKSVLLDIKGEIEIKESEFYCPCLKQRLTAPRKPKAFTMKRATIMRKYLSRLFLITPLPTAARLK